MRTGSERAAEEGLELADHRFDVFRNEIGLNVRGARDLEEFLVLRARGGGEGFLGHVEGVRLFTRHHEQRLIDEFDLIARVPGHQIHEARGRVGEGGVGVTMGLAVVDHAFAVEVGILAMDSSVRASKSTLPEIEIFPVVTSAARASEASFMRLAIVSRPVLM